MIGKITLLFIIAVSPIFALDLNETYQEGANTGKAHSNEAIESLKNLNQNDFPLAKELPEENYYGGVTQKSDNLETEAGVRTSQNEVGIAIRESFDKRPYYKVNPDSESMQKLSQIAEHADDIVHGKSTDTTTCSLKPKKCTYQWLEKTCTSSKILGDFRCSKTLSLKVKPYKIEAYNLNLMRDFLSKNPYQLTVDLRRLNTCMEGRLPCYSISKNGSPTNLPALPQNCAKVEISIVDPDGIVVLEKGASCFDPTFTIFVGKNSYDGVPYYYNFSFTVQTYEVVQDWTGNCLAFKEKEKAGFCWQNKAHLCKEPNQTRDIDGISFTRSCWKEDNFYTCGNADKDTCEPLITKGCEQSNSVCIKEVAGQCLEYEQSYQCPENKCTDNELICGDKAFCMDGACSSQELEKGSPEDFKKAITSLAAYSGAAKDYNGDTHSIFNGQLMECSKEIIGFKNCCSNKGWGLDLNLSTCTEDEHKLGKARENKLVIETGEYCYKREELPVGSVCTERHRTFCVFQSKLARIIQEQGRLGQLHMSLGEGKHSNCSGLTPKQLQSIQFEGIDFSEIYDEIKSHVSQPDYEKTSQSITKRLNDFYNQGGVND